MTDFFLRLLVQLAISIGIPALIKWFPGIDPALVQKLIEIIEKAVGGSIPKAEAKSLVAMTIAEHRNGLA